jgi:hypothetical protein
MTSLGLCIVIGFSQYSLKMGVSTIKACGFLSGVHGDVVG